MHQYLKKIFRNLSSNRYSSSSKIVDLVANIVLFQDANDDAEKITTALSTNALCILKSCKFKSLKDTHFRIAAIFF